MSTGPETPPPPRDLQSLLALKRHEQPPPGYFDRLPGQILARLTEDPRKVDAPSWWAQLKELWATQPALAGAYGVVVAGLLFLGAGVSQLTVDAQSPEIQSPFAPAWHAAIIPASTLSSEALEQDPVSLPALALRTNSSVAPVLATSPFSRSLQNGFGVQRVSYFVQ